MIEVKNLTQKYGNFIAVDNVSFTVNHGEIVGLLGPNGAGKTTTLKTLICYLPPFQGDVKVDGKNIQEQSIEVRKKIGYLSENAPLYEEMNVEEYLTFVGEMHDMPREKITERIPQIAKQCGLEKTLKKDIKILSKGYHQRVGLAQALIHDPKILILDEPTTGLDPNQRIEIRQLIKQLGRDKTIILSSHVLSEVEATCDRVLIIHKGKIIASGTPRELQKQSMGKTLLYITVEGSAPEMLAKIHGCPVIERVVEHTASGGMTKLVIETKESIQTPESTETPSDPRKQLIHHIRDHGLELLEIYSKEQSLEDIFVQFTK